MVGIVAMKELLTSVAEQEGGEISLRKCVADIMHPPSWFRKPRRCRSCLKPSKPTASIWLSSSMSLVALPNIVITLEDILEEIVGDYDDEFTGRHRQIKKLEGSRA